MTVVINVDASDTQAKLGLVEWIVSHPGRWTFLSQMALPYLQQRVGHAFATESDPTGAPWAPLSEATQKFREDLGLPPEHPINVRFGDLKNWLTNATGMAEIGPDSTALLFPGGVAGDLQAKLIAAQEGIGEVGTFPARPILGLTTADVIVLAGLFEQFVKVAMKGATIF